MPSNKTHYVAYTGSYSVILYYTAGTQLHDDGHPRPSSIALFKYVTSGGPPQTFTTTVHDGVNDGTRVLPIGSE